MQTRIKPKKKKTDLYIAISKLGLHCLTIESIDRAASSVSFRPSASSRPSRGCHLLRPRVASFTAFSLPDPRDRVVRENELRFELWRRNMIWTSESERERERSDERIRERERESLKRKLRIFINIIRISHYYKQT